MFFLTGTSLLYRVRILATRILFVCPACTNPRYLWGLDKIVALSISLLLLSSHQSSSSSPNSEELEFNKFFWAFLAFLSLLKYLSTLSSYPFCLWFSQLPLFLDLSPILCFHAKFYLSYDCFVFKNFFHWCRRQYNTTDCCFGGPVSFAFPYPLSLKEGANFSRK